LIGIDHIGGVNGMVPNKIFYDQEMKTGLTFFLEKTPKKIWIVI
jgi:hypothetical protein